MGFIWEELKKLLLEYHFNSVVSDVRHRQACGSRIHTTDLAGPDASMAVDGTYSHKREGSPHPDHCDVQTPSAGEKQY